MKKVISDGWHDIKKWCDVYTKDGFIIRATKEDQNKCRVSAAVYKKSPQGGWDRVMPCKYATFRAGLRKGTYTIL